MKGHESSEKNGQVSGSALEEQVKMLQKAIDELKTQTGMKPQPRAESNLPPQQPQQASEPSKDARSSVRPQKASASQSKEELRLESLAKLVSELQMDNMKLRDQLKKSPSDAVSSKAPGGTCRSLRSHAPTFKPTERSASPPRLDVVLDPKKGSPRLRQSRKQTPQNTIGSAKSSSFSGSRHSGSRSSGSRSGKMTQLPTVEVVKEAGGSDADLSFLKYHQDILDTFRPALRALVSGLINYKFEHHDHVILPYYRTYVYGGEAYILYHEADKVQKKRSALERAPFRRPLDMDVFVPIDVKDWSEPHRLQRKQELFIQDLWKIWGRSEVQMLADMAMRSLNNRGFDLTGPYMSTAVSALFLKDAGGRMVDPRSGQMQFHASQIDNDRMYRKVCLEYYDATADHMVTLCEFQLKPRISWGDFDEVYTMKLNAQDFTVNTMHRGAVVIKNKRAELPPSIRVPSVKKVIRVACTGVSGNRAVQIREVNGVVQLHAPQDRCRNPNPQGIPTVPIKAVTDLSRRDWFLDTVVTPLMKTDPEILQDVRQLSRKMQKDSNVFPELGMLDVAFRGSYVPKFGMSNDNGQSDLQSSGNYSAN